MGKKTRNVQCFGAKALRRGRTFIGCYNCRARKVKCNEALPECGPCKKRGITCSGYESRLVWVTSDQKSYKPNGRRFLHCKSTWNGASILSSEELDYFVSLCDAAQYVKDFTVKWNPELLVPFGAFPSKNCASPPMPHPSTLPRSLLYGTPLKDDEAFLFQHYVKHVAYIMMPYEDSRNPWQSSYPAVALYYMSNRQRSLCMALLAQAAFNLSHLGYQRERMLEVATKYYVSAMEDLRSNLIEQQEDYGTIVASIMTLMFVEIYCGNSRSWRAHFEGAWKFLVEQQHRSPWNTSIFAELTTQSLCLVKIICDTSRPDEEPGTFDFAATSEQDRLLSSITSSPLFGFTIGATGMLILCIADIKRVGYEVKTGVFSNNFDDIAHDLLVRLEHCRNISADGASIKPHVENLKNSNLAVYHLNAFIAATYIYLHQTLFGSPPNHVRQYVQEVFHNIQAFFALGDGNFSLWPAFIASTAAYEPEDVEAAKVWLRNASQVGIGNRVELQAVIEEVWRLREINSAETGQDTGSIIVDWRVVMRNLDLDIPLV